MPRPVLSKPDRLGVNLAVWQSLAQRPSACSKWNSRSKLSSMANQSPLLIAADHAGFELKEHLKKLRPNLLWEDLGTASGERVDYPDFAYKLATRITKDTDRGVLICGSGQGMMIGANRFPKVRAALAWMPEIAKLSRTHNDANVLCLASKFTDAETAALMLDIFLNTKFEGGRHLGRVAKLTTPPNC